MSQLFKTNLEEYARQCTLQRRHYEECIQQAQQSCAVDTTVTSTDASAQHEKVGKFIGGSQLDVCLEQATQSCMIDLLDIPADLLGWDDETTVSTRAESESTEAPQRYSDRSAPRQAVVNSTAKSPSPVGFGAP